jgi:fused signal recognition particle receptor
MFESSDFIIGITILFVVIGVSTSLVYYFARYYVKTDDQDKELLTKKPFSIGLEEPAKTKSDIGADQSLSREILSKSSSGADLSRSLSAAVAKSPAPARAQVVAKKSLNEALAGTRGHFWGRLKSLKWSAGPELPSALRDEIEEVLYTSDIGPQVAERLLVHLQNNLSGQNVVDENIVKSILRKELLSMLSASQVSESIETKQPATGLRVWMVVGVNGAGKTTTIGKLASQMQAQGDKVLIVAGDTFRAAADSQLQFWAERAGCEIFSSENTKDPGAVAYAGIERAKSLGCNRVIVDTAGRLHTQDHLMEELKKIKRVISKLDATAPHETLLVLDANSGQNAIEQAKQFHKAVTLTGVIVTKMDGSSKAGMVLAIAQDLQLPIRYIGVGEAIEDLRPFEAQPFVEALL